jgi:hypothetical protein
LSEANSKAIFEALFAFDGSRRSLGALSWRLRLRLFLLGVEFLLHRIEQFFNLVEAHWLLQNGNRSRIDKIGHRSAGDEDNSGVRIFGKKIPAGGSAVQSAHGEIHQHNVRTMAMVGSNRRRAGADNLHDVMSGSGHEQSHGVTDLRLIIDN